MLDFPAATNNQSLGHERSSILGVYVFELCIFAARIVLSPPILVTVVVQTDAETDSSKEGNIREVAFLLHRCSFFVYSLMSGPRGSSSGERKRQREGLSRIKTALHSSRLLERTFLPLE
jgi:hypothetical protein